MHWNDAFGLTCFTWWNKISPLSKERTVEACLKDINELVTNFHMTSNVCIIVGYSDELVQGKSTFMGNYFQDFFFFYVMLCVYVTDSNKVNVVELVRSE